MKSTKLLFVTVVLLSFAFIQNLQAQTNKEELEMYQSIFGMEKKALVADFLKLKADDPFWAIYDEYETKRKELGKSRWAVLEDYAKNYDKMDDAKNDQVIKSMIELRTGTDKLIDTYYKKIKKSNGSKVAAQFFQIEALYLSAIRIEILSQIPFIGELEIKK